MRNYYTIFDIEKNRLGLARSINWEEEEEVIDEVIDEGFAWYFIVLIVVGGVILSGLVVLGCYWIRRYRKSRSDTL